MAPRQKRRAALSEEERQARRAERKRRAAEKARDGANAAAPPARPSKYDVDIALNEAILRALDARVRADGAELLLVSIPMPDAPRARLRAASERIGLRHLSLDAAFDAVREPTRFENDPHWTPLGHEVAADAIEAFLIEQDVFETGAAR